MLTFVYLLLSPAVPFTGLHPKKPAHQKSHVGLQPTGPAETATPTWLLGGIFLTYVTRSFLPSPEGLTGVLPAQGTPGCGGGWGRAP